MTARRLPVALPAWSALMAVLATLLVLALPAPSALAAPPEAPSGLTPDGGSVSGTPILSWDRVPAATKYRVEVSANPDHSSPFFATDTLNLNAVPTAAVPAGTIYWRVRAVTGSENGDWSTATFVRDPVAPPVNRVPSDGDELQAPSEVPVLTWSAVPSAESYAVQVSDDPSFSADRIVASVTATKNTSYSLPKLQAPGDYYWRVSAALGSGRSTVWSDSTRYRIIGLSAPQLTAPADDPSGATPITEVVLDWTAVDGAVTYELQIDTDENFTSPDHTKLGIVNTRYSPTAGLGNDQYYWRVRPYDADGNKPAWSEVAVWQFRRSWPDQPDLQYPLDGSTVGDPFFYQWTAVPWASSYRLQVASSPAFSDAVTCTTVHTTLVPSFSTCMPQPGKRYYWRVIAVDGGPGIVTQAIAAEVGTFVYDVERVEQTAPADGATVEVPTLRWEPVRGAKTYKVTVIAAGNGATGSATGTTHANSFTPREKLTAGQYRWEVHPIFDDGREGTSLIASAQPRFTVTSSTATTTATPEPTGLQGVAGRRFPTLTWSKVPDAERGTTTYKLLVKRTDETTYRRVGGDFEYTAGEDLGIGFLLPGTYEWKVEAYRSGMDVATSNGAGTFVIAALDKVTGYRASLTGTAVYGVGGDTQDTCDLLAPEGCNNLRQTPVIAWSEVFEASQYELVLSRDADLTNVVTRIKVNDTRWSPSAALADSQAGSAYYVLVKPCIATVCAADEVAVRAFSKLSMGVDLVAPAEGARLTDDITLSWTSLLDTEQTPRALQDTDVATTPASIEAQTYDVQVSTRSDFNTTLVNTTVEQQTYSASTTTYPDGPLYWRVRATDGTGNKLPWSETRSFVREAPVPVQVAPAEAEQVRGEQRFSWEPRSFAKTYELEVYDRVPTASSTTGRVLNVTTTQTSYASPDRLPVRTDPYYWRLRRVDANGYKSAWSTVRTFYSAGDAPTLTSPGAGVTVSPTVLVFSWSPTTTAAARSYKWEYRTAGTTTAKASVETRALDYAIVGAFAAGDYDWRVVAVDTAGNAIGASPWRAFSVVDPPTTTTPVRIEGTGKIGTLLLVREPVWNVSGVETTYQWYRGRDAIAGETGESYRVVEADRKKSITVKATGTKPGYKPGSSTSNAIVGGDVQELQPTVAPSISGDARVGGQLEVDPGSWPGEPEYDYQWYRSGKVIPGATATTYDVVVADAGRDLAVLVTADDPDDDFGPGQAAAGPERVAKLRSTTSLRAPKKVSAKKQATVVVTVKAPGLTHPLGKVTIKDGTRTLVTRSLGSSAGGRISIKLPKLTRGRHVLRASYAGSTATNASASSQATLTVTR